MRRICALAAAGLLAGAASGWAAGVSIKDAPNLGRPGINTNVSGSGFSANEAVDVYFDTTDLLLDVTDDSGNFGADGLKTPADAAPGTHWITAVGRHDGIAAHALFTVRTNWAERGFDERSRRYNRSENTIDAANVSRLDLNWAANTGGSVVSSAAYNGTIYVGSADGKLYALSPTGVLKWSVATGGAILSSPAIANSNIYVGSSDGKLYAFKSANGAVAWSVAVGGPIVSSPVITGGIVYAGCAGDGKVYAFNISDGTAAWSAPAVTGGLDYSSPAIAKGNIYIGSLDGRVYAFSGATGALVWSAAAAGGPIESSPAVANGRVFVGSTDQKISDKSLYVFTLDGGNASRHRDTRPPSFASLHPDKRLKAVKHNFAHRQ